MSNITDSIKPLDIVSAINGAYSDIGGKQDELVSGDNIKTVNSSSILGEGDLEVASSAQGNKADTALQPEDVVSTYSATGTAPVNGTAVAQALGTLTIPQVDQTHLASSTNAQSGTAVAQALQPITTVIPSAASSSNQLADKSFVNSSISTNTATFRGTFSSVEALNAYTGEKTNNDYAFVETVDSVGNNFYDRYKYNGTAWVYEFKINNTTFTQGEWNALDSGVTSSIVSLATSALQMSDVSSSYSSTGSVPVNGTAVASAILGKQDTISDLDDIRAGALYGASALQPSDVVSTYSATGTMPVNGTAIASAIASINADVEQTYNASSTKAQSGIAVAQALSNVNIQVDQTYSASSTIAQSGTAVAEALSTLDIPLVDETFNASSTNAQSGTAVAGAVSSILPDQTGNSGKFLTTNGTTASWAEVQGGSISINVLSTSGTISLADNSINAIEPSGNVTFTLPTVTDNTVFHQILVQVNLSTVYTITLGTSYFFNKTAPDLSATGMYNLVYEYDKINGYWIAGCVPKGASS